LELIDELQESFKKALGELEEFDLEEIERDLIEKFDDILDPTFQSAPHSFFRIQPLLTASLRKFSAPSSVSLDIEQHCCPFVNATNAAASAAAAEANVAAPTHSFK